MAVTAAAWYRPYCLHRLFWVLSAVPMCFHSLPLSRSHNHHSMQGRTPLIVNQLGLAHWKLKKEQEFASTEIDNKIVNHMLCIAIMVIN